MSAISLNIILLKEGYDEKNALREALTPIPLDGVNLYYKVSTRQPPKWQSFFKEKVPSDIMTGGNPAAVVFYAVKVKGKADTDEIERTFALTFGTGRFLLRQEAIETKFGLFTTLSSIDPDSIKLIDVSTVENIPISSKTQPSKSMGLLAVGFDSNSDVLRGVKGKVKKPYDTNLGETMRGADTLQLALDKKSDDMARVLAYVYERYKSGDYKKDFDYLSKIEFISDKELIKTLTDQLIDKIKNNDCEHIWLGIPEIEHPDVVFYGVTEKGNKYDDLSLDEVLAELKIKKTEVDEKTFSNRKIFGFDANDERKQSWPLFKCFFAEIEKDGKTYVLNSGEWYEIDKEFADGLNDFYLKIKISKFDFIPYDDNVINTAQLNKSKPEATYNQLLQTVDAASRILCDANCINHGGGRNKIELCDVVTINKQLIHVKISTTSAPLSHLFSQGQVSGELLKRDSKFLKKANDKFFNPPFAPIDIDDIRRGKYEVIYGIIQKNKENPTAHDSFRPSLPIFSKITLKRAVENLEELGYKVSIAGIPDLTSPNPAKSKSKPKKKTTGKKSSSKTSAKSKSIKPK